MMTRNEDANTLYRPLKRISPTPLYYPLSGVRRFRLHYPLISGVAHFEFRESQPFIKQTVQIRAHNFKCAAKIFDFTLFPRDLASVAPKGSVTKEKILRTE